MKNCFSLILFLLFSFSVFSQDYNLVDAKVKKYPKQFRSIEYLAKRIDKDFSSKTDKLRAAFFWIANNIEYDYNEKDDIVKKVVNKNSFKNHLYNTNKYKYAEKALVSKKAVCSGYALLLKYLLEELDITCEFITGSAKTHAREIGVKTKLENHAWNAVRIDDKWKLIDVTWSTGNNADNLGKFNFKNTYYLISPRKLILNHLPKNKKWQLLKKPISKPDFVYKPLFYGPYFNSGLQLNSNTSGIIKTKSKKPIILVFDSIDTSKKYYSSYSNDEYSKPISFIKKDNKFYAKIEFNSTKRNYLLISDGSNGLIEFKVIPGINTSY